MPTRNTPKTGRMALSLSRPFGRGWALLLGAALVVGPLVTLIRDRHTLEAGSAPVAFASAALAVLVLWRNARVTQDRREAESQITFMGLHDELTGLPNRALLVDRLELALARSLRTEDLITVIALGVDGFKPLNDGLGHDVGDLLLKEVATRLSHELRPEDTVARFGGDEFVILAEDVASHDDASALAERLRVSLTDPFHLGGQDVFATASFGVALAGNQGRSPTTLLQHADAAMYRAKEAGRDRVEFFDARMQEAVETHLALSGDLHRALVNGELVVHYQPIVDLESEEMIGTEALIRWQHPERGLIRPDQFISIAESSGLINPIGTWVLDTALAQLAEWQGSVRRFAGMEIAVNVSAIQLVRRDFPRDVASSLSRSGVDPKFVVLEITEGILLEDASAALRAMQELKDLGVQIALDDFGTGYSSLSYLLRFPVDILKIDLSFVRGLGVDADATAIVGSVVSLGRTLGLKVIAEGVETEAQFQHLKRVGCPMAQGYHFGRPSLPDGVVLTAESWENASSHDSVMLSLSALAARGA
jgi:diguanylate cyclase (GGDEF)-like protein